MVPVKDTRLRCSGQFEGAEQAATNAPPKDELMYTMEW